MSTTKKWTMLSLVSFVLVCGVIAYTFAGSYTTKENGNTPVKAKTEKATYPIEETQKTIADVIKGDKECSEFADMATKTGLMKRLAEQGPITIIVPVNSAIDQLPENVRAKIRENMKNEERFCKYGTFNRELTDEQLLTSEKEETLCMDENGKACMFVCEEHIKDMGDFAIRGIKCTNGRVILVKMAMVPPMLQDKEMSTIEKAEKNIEKAEKTIEKSVEKMRDAVLPKTEHDVVPKAHENY